MAAFVRCACCDGALDAGAGPFEARGARTEALAVAVALVAGQWPFGAALDATIRRLETRPEIYCYAL